MVCNIQAEALGLTRSALLSIHYHVIEIFLYEGAIDARDQPSENGTYPFARLHMLHECLEATRQCFTAFHSIPPSQLFDLPYTTLTFLGHAVVVLSKLSLLRTKDWDDARVQNVVDFSGTIGRLIQKIHDAKAVAKSAAERDGREFSPQNVPKMFRMLPDTLRKVEAVHEAMNAAQLRSSSQGPQSPSAEFVGAFTEDEFLTMSAQSFPDVFNDGFWQQYTWP